MLRRYFRNWSPVGFCSELFLVLELLLIGVIDSAGFGKLGFLYDKFLDRIHELLEGHGAGFVQIVLPTFEALKY